MSDSEGSRSSPPELAAPDYAQLRSELVRAVARVCPPALAARADDLVQTALVRLFEICRRGEGKGEFSALYLRKAAYSTVIDEIRRQRRRQEVALSDGSDGKAESVLPAADPDPERHSAGREIGRAIRDCLTRMVRPRRLAVTLHLQGHRVPEVSRLLRWSLKKAENLVYRGLADLRECLAAKGVAP